MRLNYVLMEYSRLSSISSLYILTVAIKRQTHKHKSTSETLCNWLTTNNVCFWSREKHKAFYSLYALSAASVDFHKSHILQKPQIKYVQLNIQFIYAYVYVASPFTKYTQLYVTAKSVHSKTESTALNELLPNGIWRRLNYNVWEKSGWMILCCECACVLRPNVEIKAINNAEGKIVYLFDSFSNKFFGTFESCI